MGYQRLAYDEQDTTDKMLEDCSACASQLPPPERRVRPAGPLSKDKAEIQISEATAYLASRLRLGLD